MGWANLEDRSDRTLGKILQCQQDRYSYARVNELANKFAAGLSNLGIGKVDTVAVFMENCPEFIFAAFGAKKLGAIWVPTNTDYKGEWLYQALQDSIAKVLIVDVALLPLCVLAGFRENILLHRFAIPEMRLNMIEYLQPTPTIDSDHFTVKEFAKQHSSDHKDHRQQAVQLYYAVRDGIRYDPYSAVLSVEGIRASTTLSNERGWCVAKAILLAACCRSIGIPARLGYADVLNHLSTERMRNVMKNDVFYWHGYTSIYLNGRWIKVTPAFNIELCHKLNIKPLDFDGFEDALFHPFDLEGNRHMEYLQYRGEFADVPIDLIKETFEKGYPLQTSFDGANFEHDVEQETLP
jgi:transglutaminase-like putative cysteine protease